MKKLMKFDWVLDIKINSPLIIFILFHPVYIIWLYKIGRLGEKWLSKNINWLFLILNGFLFITMILFISRIQLFSNDSGFLKLLYIDEKQLINIIAVLVAISWIYCSYYSMKMTIKLDEMRDEDYYPSIIDKLFRFFQILYWVFGIWVIQPRINKYYEELKKDSNF